VTWLCWLVSAAIHIILLTWSFPAEPPSASRVGIAAVEVEVAQTAAMISAGAEPDDDGTGLPNELPGEAGSQNAAKPRDLLSELADDAPLAIYDTGRAQKLAQAGETASDTAERPTPHAAEPTPQIEPAPAAAEPLEDLPSPSNAVTAAPEQEAAAGSAEPAPEALIARDDRELRRPIAPDMPNEGLAEPPAAPAVTLPAGATDGPAALPSEPGAAATAEAPRNPAPPQMSGAGHRDVAPASGTQPAPSERAKGEIAEERPEPPSPAIRRQSEVDPRVESGQVPPTQPAGKTAARIDPDESALPLDVAEPARAVTEAPSYLPPSAERGGGALSDDAAGAAPTPRGARNAGPIRAMSATRGAAAYRRVVQAQIARNRPADAELAGRVVVGVQISKGGMLRRAWIVRSSGRALLDRSALAAVGRAAPFPAPPANVNPTRLRYAIPFEFR
jgi:protein TonB